MKDLFLVLAESQVKLELAFRDQGFCVLDRRPWPERPGPNYSALAVRALWTACYYASIYNEAGWNLYKRKEAAAAISAAMFFLDEHQYIPLIVDETSEKLGRLYLETLVYILNDREVSWPTLLYPFKDQALHKLHKMQERLDARLKSFASLKSAKLFGLQAQAQQLSHRPVQHQQRPAAKKILDRHALFSKYFSAAEQENPTALFHLYLQERAKIYWFTDWLESWLLLLLGSCGYQSQQSQRACYIDELESAFLQGDQNCLRILNQGLMRFKKISPQEQKLYRLLLCFKADLSECRGENKRKRSRESKMERAPELSF